MTTKATRSKLASAAGLLLAFGLALSGCSAAPVSAPDGPSATGPAASQTPAPGAPDGPVDCVAVVGVFTAFLEAAFSGISTEATNGKVAAKFQLAAQQFDTTAVPRDATGWSELGRVIHAYADEWAALDPSGSAIENLEPVEDRVDALAESIGFNNDNYDDNTNTLIGEQCADEFEAMFQQ